MLLLLEGCGAHRRVEPTPPESFEAMLLRTEGVTCRDLTLRMEGAPVPDCKKVYSAWKRGQARVAANYPAAAGIKMEVFTFFQTNVTQDPSEGFHRMKNGMAPGAIGATAPYPLCTLFHYAEEWALEHEAVHGLICLLDPLVERTPWAINNPKDLDQSTLHYIQQITCHNTSDDPYGDGTSASRSGRAGCFTLEDR